MCEEEIYLWASELQESFWKQNVLHVCLADPGVEQTFEGKQFSNYFGNA